MTVQIRAATQDDAEQIAAIYGYYVRHDLATFDETPPPAAYFADRMRTAVHPWLVAQQADRIIGYCYAGPYRPRPAYRHTAETSIYLAPDARGQKVGMALMTQLIEALRQDPTPIKQLLAGIAIADHDPAIGAGSVALHKRLGFELAGVLKNTGYKFDQWLHVAFYQMEI